MAATINPTVIMATNSLRLFRRTYLGVRGKGFLGTLSDTTKSLVRIKAGTRESVFIGVTIGFQCPRPRRESLHFGLRSAYTFRTAHTLVVTGLCHSRRAGVTWRL